MRTAKRFLFCLVSVVALTQRFGRSPSDGVIAAAAAVPTSVSCNVRSASGCGPGGKVAAAVPGVGSGAAGGRSLLGSEEHWRFNSLSLRHGAEFVWLYRGNPFDITLDTSAATSFADPVIEMTVTMLDTFRITAVRQPTGQLWKAFEVISTAPGRDTVKLIVQHRMLDILRQLDSIDASNPRTLVFRAGAWTLAFDRIPLTDPTDGQEWYPVTLPLRVRVLDVVPETYFVNGHFENLFPTADAKTPLRVFIIQTSENSINVLLETARNAFAYRVHYQPQDGWVTLVEPLTTTTVGFGDENNPDYGVEKKVVDIISRVQQLAFENKNLVQFITNNGNTRISFAGPDETGTGPNEGDCPYVARYFRDWDIGTQRLFLVQQEGGTDAIRPLVPWGNSQTPGVFMSVVVERTARNHLALTVLGVNTSPFDIDFDASRGKINGVIARPTTNLANADATLIDLEKHVRRALGSSVRLVASELDGIIFLNPQGDATLTLVPLTDDDKTPPPPPRVYDLKPETYMVNGKFESLFPFASVPSVPITLLLEEKTPGVGQFVVRGVNSIVFEVTWQPEDGWVKSVWPGARTHVNEPYDVVGAEQKVADLLGMVQQLSFDKDGLLQVISNNAQNRVAFMQRQETSRRLMAESTALKFARYLVEPSTYMTQGQLQALFGGPTALPVIVHVRHLEPGHIGLTVEVVNTMPYDIYYDEMSGLVSQVVPGTVIVAGIETPEDIAVVERRLHNLLVQCHAMVFLDDGIKFNTVDGGIATRGLTVGEYSLLPHSYERDGTFEHIATDPRFPVTLTLVQDAQGNAKALLKAVNIIDFYIRFQHRDGWVLQRQEIGQTRRALTRDQRDTERKLLDILRSVQQLAFEKDGVLQLITNNGRTRVAFKGDNHAWWDHPFDPVEQPKFADYQPPYYYSSPASSQTPYYRQTPRQATEAPPPTKHVMPETYRRDGRSDPLFTGPSFPISVSVRQPYSGYVEIAINMINHLVYGVHYQARDGWVLSRMLLFESNRYPTVSEAETEAKIKYILDNLQQIAFETSGQLQFITDNAQTRISFI